MRKPIISSFGENAILLKWPTAIDAKMHAEILAWETLIKTHFDNDILDLVVTYAEMALYFKSHAPLEEITAFIQTINTPKINERKSQAWVIPVCYDSEFGLDIDIVAEHNNISADQVVILHTAQPCRIYFTGFLPGFLYLGGLADQLVTPRKKTPRLQISKGAVAIGGSQTGIYPIDSPGGWQIIGHTPIELFNLSKTEPSPFLPGDFIHFQSITKDQLEAISVEIEAGIYNITKGTVK
ncbi:MAG: inhibitor of KinA [Crocinitomix sp.]|jgi:inhibitor of KinA